jgi:hypothetical protein
VLLWKASHDECMTYASAWLLERAICPQGPLRFANERKCATHRSTPASRT